MWSVSYDLVRLPVLELGKPVLHDPNRGSTARPVGANRLPQHEPLAVGSRGVGIETGKKAYGEAELDSNRGLPGRRPRLESVAAA